MRFGALNLLILDRIEKVPKYRGGGAGLLVLISLIERFGAGAGVIGIKPFPLQFEPGQRSDSSAWAKRLRLGDLSRDPKMSTRKLKQYHGKLGFVEMKSTPIHVPEQVLAAPVCRKVALRIILLTDLRHPEFGRLRFESDQFMQCDQDFSSRLGQAYGDKNDYALYEDTGYGLDTAGVAGSGPDAPAKR
jgi:hypothetical protein